MRIIKKLTLTLISGVIVTLVLINGDKFFVPEFKHRLFDSTFLGTHYFVNDLAGISPRQPSLPHAFVISHSARGAALVADKITQKYQLVPADEFGLSQDPAISGWGALEKPVISNAVLHLYYYRTFLVGVYQPDDAQHSARSLTITIPWQAIHAVNGDIKITASASEKSTQFEVLFDGKGSFWLETQPPPSDGFEIEFLQQGFLPGEVVVGAEQVKMMTPQFDLSTMDMHSFALTELDGDPGTEFSIVRGGMRGRLDEVDSEASDILIDADTSNNITDNYPSFKKRGCPGRQSAWLDIDVDGDLDLYVSCGRPDEPTALFPNQLFENTGHGFIENAEKFGVNFKPYGAFRYIDWDGDTDPDLWWASANGELQYYENQNTYFVLSDSYRGSWQGNYRPPQLLITDLTENGSPDLLVTHPDGNRLIINQRGNRIMGSLPTWGLPDKTVAASWLDIDLDGKVDLLTALDGVYIYDGNSSFRHDKSQVVGGMFISDARLVSYSGKEGRKFLLAYRRCLPGKLCGGRRVALGVFRKFFPLDLDMLEPIGLIEPYDWYLYGMNRRVPINTYREVAISLQGTRYNPNAIGGRIDLTWHSQNRSYWVTEAESSLYSQADLTIYASLPVSGKVSGNAVWPDGCKTTFMLPLDARQYSVKRPLLCH